MTSFAMVERTLLTPRPLPDRRLPAVAGGLVVALALPAFVAAGWPLVGWAIGAAFWVGARLLERLFDRIGIGEPTLKGSGVVAFGMMGRGIALGLVAIALAVYDPHVALAAALVYAFGYTVELALSLTLYFSAKGRQ